MIKMDGDVSAAGQEGDYYKDYYNTLINECLSVIANTVVPNQKVMTFTWKGYLHSDDELPDVGKPGDYYTVGEEIENQEKVGYVKRKDWVEWKDGKWQKQDKNTYGFLATIPDDFLSFSDESATQFWNKYGELELNVDVLYVNSKTLALSKDGTYEIWYNAEYDKVTDTTDELNIPSQVLSLIPSYVAGQLLMGEDPIKATQLKNEFETMMARLDTNKPLVSYKINNDDGWVL